MPGEGVIWEISWAKTLFGHFSQNAGLRLLFRKRASPRFGENLQGRAGSSLKDSERRQDEAEVGQNSFFPSQNCTQTPSGAHTG